MSEAHIEMLRRPPVYKLMIMPMLEDYANGKSITPLLELQSREGHIEQFDEDTTIGEAKA